MIRRLRQLQREESPTEESNAVGGRTWGARTDGTDGTDGGAAAAETGRSLPEDTLKPSSLPGSTRLLPDFLYQASTEGGRGGTRPAGSERTAGPRLRTEEEPDAREWSEKPSSHGSWSEVSSMVIGSDYCLSPLSPAMEQRLLLQYLTPLGDYQEVSRAPGGLRPLLLCGL